MTSGPGPPVIVSVPVTGLDPAAAVQSWKDQRVVPEPLTAGRSGGEVHGDGDVVGPSRVVAVVQLLIGLGRDPRVIAGIRDVPVALGRWDVQRAVPELQDVVAGSARRVVVPGSAVNDVVTVTAVDP